jgi:hypothetical protein
VALLLAVAGCSGHSRSVDRFGVKVDLPKGWTGEVYRRGTGLVILHAASFRLGAHEGYDPLGTIERRDRLVDARTGMDSGDVGIAVFAYTDVPRPHAPRLEGDLVLRRADRKGMEGFPAGRATYSRTFTEGGRQVQVIVEFGSERPRSALVKRVNDVLRTLAVGPQ